jgi:hypothetical protein
MKDISAVGFNSSQDSFKTEAIILLKGPRLAVCITALPIEIGPGYEMAHRNLSITGVLSDVPNGVD